MEVSSQNGNAVVRILQTVTVAANDKISVEEAMEITLAEVCAFTGWPVGHVYLVSETFPKKLISSSIWKVSDPELFKEFMAITELTDFAPGMGLPGQVFSSAEPKWVSDINRALNFPRAKELKELSLRSGFAFPVLIGREVMSVLEFFSGKPAEPDEELLKVMAHVGIQLGRKVERFRSENALCRAKEKAENATRVKDKFVELVAHDMKAPFTSIMGLLNILMMETPYPLSAKQKEIIDRILKIGRNQVKTIDKLLNIGRLQTGKITPRPRFFDGFNIIQNAIHCLGCLAEEKGIKIENRVPRATRLYADIELYGEVIQNLLYNSIKYCRKGDQIVFFRPENSQTGIAVRDTGVGIPEKHMPDLFKYEIKTASLGTLGENGSGLGLPLSNDIIKAHNGCLRVESAREKGTTFFVELPFARPRVLLVDDEEVVRSLLIYALDNLNVEIMQAENGIEALRIIDETNPHLIISDLMMPEMDGFRLLDEIKMHPENKTIPVIVLTADHNMLTREKAFQKGANDFANKPVVMEDLLPRVQRFLV